MVAKRVSEAELASSLAAGLERARTGERFAIERDGEIITEVIPSSLKPGNTLRDLALELARLPALDEDLAADVEATRAILLPADPSK